MNLSRLTAILLALMMALTLLSGCGDEQKEEPSDDDVENTVQPGDDGNEAILNSPGFYIDGVKIDTDNLVMMTIDGVEIPFDLYRYMYQYLDAYYFSGSDKTYWDNAENAANFSDLLTLCDNYMREASWGNILANKYGIELTDEDNAQIEEYLEEERSYFESEEEYKAMLEASGISEDTVRRLITDQVMANRVYEDLYHAENAPLAPSDEEIKEAVAKDYVRVYHVLISFDHFADDEEYADATEDELKEAAKAYAEELLERIKNGESIYDLAQSDGDDPGMTDNEAGYLFTYGSMVQEFEDASFALDVGETSDLVETSYGYHIIQRIEQDQYVDEHFDTVRENYIINVFNEDIDELIENAEVVYCEYYDKMTPDSIQ